MSDGCLLRTLAICALAAVAPAISAPAISLVSLQPNEHAAMMSTCNRLAGNDRALCHHVVDDPNVTANYKRSCMESMTALLQGSTWARVKSLPATISCTYGLGHAGYPVKNVMRRLTGVE